MRLLLVRLALLSLLLTAGVSLATWAVERQAGPSAERIERLLRDLLAKEDGSGPSLHFLGNAKLLEFRLLELEPGARSRWHAEIEVLSDFGPPPPDVFGFERIRQSRFGLILEERGEALELLRFTPLSRVHPLPARALHAE